MNTDSYEKEFLAMRYSLMCQSGDIRIKIEGYKKFLDLCKKHNIQDELIRSARSDSIVSQQIGNLLMECMYYILYNILLAFVESNQLHVLEDIDNFFMRLIPKDATINSYKIREYSLVYFSKGHFSQYNNIFTRYIKHMRDINDSELHDFVVKYTVSSIIKKNYEIALSDINGLRNFYIQYDFNFYIFILRMIKGEFIESCESLLNIGQNVYQDAWKIINETDFAFYCILSLIITFKYNYLKDIQNLSFSMANKSLEDFPENLEILENFYKCRFDWITEKFEKIQRQIINDPLLCNIHTKINYELKNNILKKILKSCSCISLSYICYILRENDIIKIENWILTGISQGHLNLNIRIDDIDKLVYISEKNSSSECLKRTLELTRETFNNSINKIITKGNTIIEIQDSDIETFKKYHTSNKGTKGDLDYEVSDFS